MFSSGPLRLVIILIFLVVLTLTQIEYKFKLPKPSPLRLAKLVTQLKWRLIEGGGIACYELGVLDNGTVVGLNRAEMAESLETLGTMLSALGGGKIKVARVVKFGGASGEETSDSGGDTSSSDAAPHLFESFEVEAIDQPAFFSSPLDDIYNPTSTPTSVLFPSLPHPGECANNPNPTPPPTPPTSVLFTAPTLAAVTNTPNHDRTPEERAMLKRVKRDARRARRESESDAAQGANSSPKTRRVPLSPHQSSRPSPHHQNHQPHDSGVSQPVKIKGVSTNRPKPKPNSPKQLSKSAPALNHIQPRKPTLPQENGEVRYVIEAVVSKRSGRTSGTGRRNERERPLSVSTSVEDVGVFQEDEDELDGQFFNDEEGGENEEEGEGWKYLNFDSLQL